MSLSRLRWSPDQRSDSLYGAGAFHAAPRQFPSSCCPRHDRAQSAALPQTPWLNSAPNSRQPRAWLPGFGSPAARPDACRNTSGTGSARSRKTLRSRRIVSLSQPTAFPLSSPALRWKPKFKGRSLAHFAAYLDPAAEQLQSLLYVPQPQTHPAVKPGVRAVDLVEGVENNRVPVSGDTDPGIRHYAMHHPPLRRIGYADSDASLFGKFDGIIDQVAEYLGDLATVGKQRRRLRVDLPDEVQLLVPCLIAQYLEHRLSDMIRGERVRIDVCRACLELRHVDRVLHLEEQAGAAPAYGLEAVLLLFVHVAEDPIH